MFSFIPKCVKQAMDNPRPWPLWSFARDQTAEPPPHWAKNPGSSFCEHTVLPISKDFWEVPPCSNLIDHQRLAMWTKRAVSLADPAPLEGVRSGGSNPTTPRSSSPGTSFTPLGISARSRGHGSSIWTPFSLLCLHYSYLLSISASSLNRFFMSSPYNSAISTKIESLMVPDSSSPSIYSLIVVLFAKQRVSNISEIW